MPRWLELSRPRPRAHEVDDDRLARPVDETEVDYTRLLTGA